MLSLRQASSCTCGCNCLINHLNVTQCGNRILLNQCCLAAITMLAFCQTCGRTGRRNIAIYDLNVAKLANRITGVGIITTGTGMGRITVFRTGRRSNDSCIVVVQSRNFFLRSEDFLTNRTLDARSQTGGRTGRCNSFKSFLCMTCCRNLSIGSVITYRTVLVSIPADLLTSGVLCLHLR